MNKEDLIKEMKESIGTKDPIIFFQKMTDAFTMLFDNMDDLKKEVKRAQLNAVLAIDWDMQIARKMLDEEITFLRQVANQNFGTTNMFENEIKELKNVLMTGGGIIGNYKAFVAFWQDLLGYHPFLEHRK